MKGNASEPVTFGPHQLRVGDLMTDYDGCLVSWVEYRKKITRIVDGSLYPGLYIVHTRQGPYLECVIDEAIAVVRSNGRAPIALRREADRSGSSRRRART